MNTATINEILFPFALFFGYFCLACLLVPKQQQAELSLVPSVADSRTKYPGSNGGDKTAEIAGQYTTKGSLIGITGELKLDEWQN